MNYDAQVTIRAIVAMLCALFIVSLLYRCDLVDRRHRHRIEAAECGLEDETP